MAENLPKYIVQGETARLFPVLSTTSKEGRTTSIVLACMSKVDELGRQLLSSAGQRLGTRAQVDTYTEIVPAKLPADVKERPDGLIAVRIGSREWKAFVEAKVGSSELDADQVERYRSLAKENGVDCVITISNQFATMPTLHPDEGVRRSRSKIPVIHWSWMHILTAVDLLINRDAVADKDQLVLLNELRRFLSHESAGVKGFDRMPKEWSDLNRLVASGGAIPTKSPEAQAVLDAWHQETRDLSLILSRLTETPVDQRLPRKHLTDPALRQKEELATLREEKQLRVSLSIPNAAAPIDVVVDLARRCVDVGMTLRAPEEKKSTSARVNWLLKQIKPKETPNLHVKIMWPGKSAETQHLVSELRRDVAVANEGKEHLVPTSFQLVEVKSLGGRFAQQTNFIVDVEEIVPAFYRSYGSRLSAWKRPAPRMKDDRTNPADVTTEAIAEDAEAFEERNATE
ncbi:MAG: hypothetical protein AAF713_09600 [Pseudomonadota bacterium]